MSLALLFRTIGAWGAGLGRNLHPAEVDGNFYAIKQAVEDLQDNPPSAISIASVTQSGDNLTVWLTNGSSFGPFPLPTAAPVLTSGTIAGPAYTLLLDDRSKYLRCTGTDSTDGLVVTIPSDIELDLPVDTEFYFRQAAPGFISFEPSSTDTTINVVEGFIAGTDREGAVAQLKKVAADEWDLFGHLTEA